MKKKLKLLGMIVSPLFLLDQFTKAWIVRNLGPGDMVPIIPNIFELVHVTNRGAAFGVFSNLPDSIRIPFFYLLSAIALAVLLFYLFYLPTTKTGLLVCLNMILGGALGNLTDRLLRGEVVD